MGSLDSHNELNPNLEVLGRIHLTIGQEMGKYSYFQYFIISLFVWCDHHGVGSNSINTNPRKLSFGDVSMLRTCFWYHRGSPDSHNEPKIDSKSANPCIGDIGEIRGSSLDFGSDLTSAWSREARKRSRVDRNSKN